MATGDVWCVAVASRSARWSASRAARRVAQLPPEVGNGARRHAVEGAHGGGRVEGHADVGHLLPTSERSRVARSNGAPDEVAGAEDRKSRVRNGSRNGSRRAERTSPATRKVLRGLIAPPGLEPGLS